MKATCMHASRSDEPAVHAAAVGTENVASRLYQTSSSYLADTSPRHESAMREHVGVNQG